MAAVVGKTRIGPRRAYAVGAGRAAVLLVVGLFALVPVYYGVISAFKTTAEIDAGTILFPRAFTVSQFKSVFSQPALFLALRNSLVVATAATLLSIAVSAPAALALARLRFRGRTTMWAAVMVGQLFPLTAILVPLFSFWETVHLYNSDVALVLTYMAFGVPIGVWLLSAYFQTIPKEIEEQAMVDGHGQFGALARVVLPLSLPGIGAVAVYVFLQAWGEYVFALTLTASNSTHTLPVFLAGLEGQHTTAFGPLLAVAVVMMVPPFVVFFGAQRLFVSGLTTGAVRG